MPMDANAIGIDLGTTNSCVGVVRNGRVEIIANEAGNRITPSFVAFTDSERLIGVAAKEQASWNPENTIFQAKRLIGRPINNPDVQKMMERVPFYVNNCSGFPKVQVEYKKRKMMFTPEQISSMVLSKMKEVAETFIGGEVKDAVITVPAYFNDSQRQATVDAGIIAGLNILRIINEPTAAAIAYGVERKDKGHKTRNILIFDMGGGTFDVAIVRIDDRNFHVLAVDGDTFLGGCDFDDILVEHFVKEFNRKNDIDINGDLRAKGKLRKACENVKRNLSFSTKENIQIEALYNGIDFDSSITRARFENLCSDIFLSTLNPVNSVLREAKMSESQIDEIILVGGSTRIPKIQELLNERFQGKALNKTINPDEAVAYGAAFQAALLAGDTTVDEILLIDVTPLSLGIEVTGGMINKIINRNTKLPHTETKRYFTTFDNQDEVIIRIYEGERDKKEHNHLLGEFRLQNIKKARKDKKIDVTFTIDYNGILHASAIDVSTGTKNDITITSNKGRLKQDEIKFMINEAERFKKEDKTKRENMKARSDLESLIDRIQSKNKTASNRNDNQIDQTCENVRLWLDDNQNADKYTCNDKITMLNQISAEIL